MIKTVSLHSRLLLASTVPTTILMIIFCIFVILFRFQDIDNLKSETADILLSKYSLALAKTPEYRWSTVLQDALNEKYLRSIDVFDATGVKLIHAGPNSKLNYLEPNILSKLHQKKAYLSYANTDIFLIPITDPSLENALPKWLSIELQPSFFTLARYEVVIGISITTFGFISILLLWMSGNIRRWLTPIHQIAEQIKTIDPQSINKLLATDAVGDLQLLESEINLLLNRFNQEYQELKSSMEQARSDLDENLATMESRNIELRIARNEAIEGNRVKSAFLANISHELRTPLNSINGFTQLLLKMPLNHKQRDWVETIQKSSNNLLAIINDVLDFSKIEAGKFSLEKQPIILENVIFDVLESLSPQAASKGLEQVAFIYEEVPHKMIGDSLRLKQVLTNLVSNAIKFTARGEVIVRVMVEDIRPTHYMIRISVSDTGIGLTDNAKNDLFKAFQQGNPSVSRQFGGTGLGLAISKSIVKLMDGEIGFDSQQTEGSTFWFNFKAGVCVDDDKPININLMNKQILALESHDKNAQLLKSTLFNANADISISKTWNNLLEQLNDTHQVVIIDSQDISKLAYDQLKQLRKYFQGLLILFNNLSDESKLPESAFEELNIYTLSKPIRPQNLLGLLAQGLSTVRLTQQHTQPQMPAIKPNLHILAVDDHPLNLKLVCTLLEDLGLRVSCAENGCQAVELCTQKKFDLIFMDIQMPQMSGLEATQCIRQQGLNQHTPIIALTAHALADEKENMLKQGMNDYLTKPLEESQLIHIVEHWTGELIRTTNHPFINTPPPNHQFATVDWKECLKLSAGKSDLAYDMLKMLIAGLPTAKDKLKKSQQEENLPALLSHVHYLHGATRYCGVPQLRHIVSQLEKSIKEAIKQHSENDPTVKQYRELLLQELYEQIDKLCQINIDKEISL